MESLHAQGKLPVAGPFGDDGDMRGVVVYRVKDGCFHQHYGRENIVRNNILAYSATRGQAIRSREEDHRSFTFERNLVYYTQADLLGGNWSKGKFSLDYNLYWNAAGKPVTLSITVSAAGLSDGAGAVAVASSRGLEKFGCKPMARIVAYATSGIAPKDIFLEGTAQVFRGDTPGLFQAARRRDLSTIGHLRAYRDITESTNVDLGLSYARGQSPFGTGANRIYGIDATLRWKPLRRAIYRSFVARSEFMWARAQAAPIPAAFLLSVPSLRPFGYYLSTDYQLARRWFLGGRFDRSDRLISPQLTDTGGSIILTYWPSEFSQIRSQLRRTSYAGNLTANELLFQLQFSLGAHGAHPF